MSGVATGVWEGREVAARWALESAGSGWVDATTISAGAAAMRMLFIEVSFPEGFSCACDDATRRLCGLGLLPRHSLPLILRLCQA
jgi:hypothetical protein